MPETKTEWFEIIAKSLFFFKLFFDIPDTDVFNLRNLLLHTDRATLIRNTKGKKTHGTKLFFHEKIKEVISMFLFRAKLTIKDIPLRLLQAIH